MESFFEWVVESSLLVLMILGIRKFFTGKIRYAIIYALWGVVLLRFLIPVNFFTTPVSAAKLVSDAFSSSETSEKIVQGVENTQNVEENIQQSGKTEIIVVDRDASYEKHENNEKASGSRNENVQMPVHSDVTLQKEAEIKKNIDSGYLWSLFCKVWVVGAVIIFLWFLLSNVCLLKKIKRDRVLYGVRDNIDIYSVSDIKNPCLYGFLKPSIYLPVSLVLSNAGDSIDDDELEQIITHEFVHYRHGDHIWAMFRMLMVSVYWFDPFVWLASACSKKDAELFCDETVLSILGEEKRFCYGGMLVRLAGDASWGDFRYSMMPMSRKGKEMEKRIRAISEKKRYSKWLFVPLVIILSVTIAFTCSAGISPYAKEKSNVKDVSDENGAANQNVSKASAKQVEDNSATKSGYTIDRQLLAYSEFLKDNAEKPDFGYYSLGWLSDEHVVLIVASHVMDNTETKYSSSSCKIYNIVDGKVTYCGDMACSSSGEYVHISGDKIMTDTHHSVTSARVEVNSNKLLAETIEESKASDGSYSGDTEFFEEFAKAATVVFYTNPYIGKTISSEKPKAMSLQDNKECYMVYDHGYDFIYEDSDSPVATHNDYDKEVAVVYAETPKKAFELYINSFTEAVNTGDVGKLNQVLCVNSDVYDQQCGMAKNYYKRGIRETVKSWSVSTVDKKDEIIVKLISKEKIKVTYADKTSKIVKQSYCYTCEYIDNTWVITKMEDVE